MLIESTNKAGRITLLALCGATGPPRVPVFGKPGKWDGLPVTAWPSEVTCKVCSQHPGVSGRKR